METLVEACLAVSKEAVRPAAAFNGKSAGLLTKLGALVTALDAVKDVRDERIASLVFTPVYTLLHHDELGRLQLICVFKLLKTLCASCFAFSSEFSFKLALQLLSVGMFLLSPADGAEMRYKDVEFVFAGYAFINALVALCTRLGMPIGASPAVPPLVFAVVSALQQYADLDLDLELLSLLQTVLGLLSPAQTRLIMPRVGSRLVNMVNVVHKRHFRAKISALNCLSFLLCRASMENRSVDAELETNLKTMFAVVSRLFRTVNSEFKPELQESIADFALGVSKTAFGKDDASLLEIVLVSARSTDLRDLPDSEALTDLVSVHTQRLVNAVQGNFQGNSDLQFSIDVLTAVISSKPRLVNLQSLVQAVQGAMALRVRKQASVEMQNRDLVTGLPVYTTSLSFSLAATGIDGLDAETESCLAQFIQFVGARDSKQLEHVCTRLYDDSGSDIEAVRQLWLVSNLLTDAEPAVLHELMGYCYTRLSWSIDVSEAVNNAVNVRTALCLYVFGECALQIEPENVQTYLVDAVHPLFCLLGNYTSINIKNEAANCLAKLAFKLGYPNPVEMAIANHDYILDGISVQLNTLNISPSTLDSLASLFLICGPQMIEFSVDVVQSLFVLLNYYHEYYHIVRSTLTVFAAMVKVLNKKGVPKLVGYTENPEITDFSALKLALARKGGKIDDLSLDEFIASENAENAENATENASASSPASSPASNPASGTGLAGEIEDVASNSVEEWKYPIEKPVYDVLETVCEYCDKLITHESPEIRLATLTLIGMLAPFLAINHERYLPLVHKVWPEICARLFDKEVYIVEQSLKCLESVSVCAESFVEKRVEDLWPKVLSTYSSLFLRRWPEFSSEKRVQTAFCRCFSALLRLNLSFKTLEQTLVVLRPALLRNEFPQLLDQLKTGSLQTQDLVYVVLLASTQCKDGFKDVTQVYVNQVSACRSVNLSLN